MPVFTAQRVMIGAGEEAFVDPFMEEIATVTLAAPAAAVTFSGIDTAFRMFQLTGTVVKDGTGGFVNVRVNSDSGSNYDRQRLVGTSTTVAASRVSGGTAWELASLGIDANQSGTFEAFISKQAASAPAMAVWSEVVVPSAGISTGNYGLRWNNTADLINAIAVLASAGDFAANTQITLNGDRSLP